MQSLMTPGSDGIGQTFVKMVRQEGILRPIRGMGAMVLGAGPAHAVYFSSYEFLKESFKELVPSARYHTLCYGKSNSDYSIVSEKVICIIRCNFLRKQTVNI